MQPLDVSTHELLEAVEARLVPEQRIEAARERQGARATHAVERAHPLAQSTTGRAALADQGLHLRLDACLLGARALECAERVGELVLRRGAHGEEERQREAESERTHQTAM
ncbi:MAG: hypothetical protein SangKO_063770 [Sandaracinaceae bacterium]